MLICETYTDQNKEKNLKPSTQVTAAVWRVSVEVILYYKAFKNLILMCVNNNILWKCNFTPQ